MRISLGTLLIAALFVTVEVCAHAQSASVSTSAADPAQAHADDGYKLVWSDEFTADGPPDPTKWTHERGFVRNQELQWYQEANANCNDGILVLEARRERLKNPKYNRFSRHWGDQREFAEYTSASIKTQDLASWRYGRFEMRGRIDVRPGMWPAWWTLGDRGGWPACGEIDMLEYYRGTLLANVAWASSRRFEPIWDDSRTPLAELGENWGDKFHTWRMEWDQKHITLSVDDRLLNETDLEKTFNDDREKKNPFRQPHYMLLTLAIGGANGGDPAQTEFPAKFEVDWVRVYQK
jgi:beta-glucanase (GH16 family)